jgi:hypothetical protein
MILNAEADAVYVDNTPVSKEGVRALWRDLSQSYFMAHRPGDVPRNFDLDGATVFDGAYGRAVQSSTDTVIKSHTYVALEPDGVLEAGFGYFRVSDPVDPAGDAVRFGVYYYDNEKTQIGSATLCQDEDLTVAQGRRIGRWYIGAESQDYVTHVAPEGTRYVRLWARMFGIDHTTAIDTMLLQEATDVLAPWVIFPDGFQWPGEVIPPIPITPLYDVTPDTYGHGLYQPDPDTLIPRDWVENYEMARTIFVSQGGDNSNSGLSLTDPVRDIEAALEIAGSASDTTFSIQLWPGSYATDGHLDVPDNVTEVAGVQGQRSVVIVPTAGNESRNVFRLGSGGMVRNLSGAGWQVDDFDNPSEGFLVAFRPDATVYRALYVDHCVMYRREPPAFLPAPVDPENGNPLIPKGPGIAIADSASVSASSPFPQIMIEASTTSAPNGVGYVVKGDAFINALNTISIWPHKHFVAMGGGEMLLNNCASQFGDYTLWAEGSVPLILPGPVAPLVADPDGAAQIAANKTTILDAMASALSSAGYGNFDPDLCRKEGGVLVDAVVYDVTSGTQESLDYFIRGLFPRGQFASPFPQPFIVAWESVRASMAGLSLSASTLAMVDAMFDVLTGTINAPRFGVKPSKISATAHQFNFPFAGVNRRAFVRTPRDVRDTVIQRDFGVVNFSGVDDRNNQFFPADMRVSGITGTMQGPPVPRTFNPLAFEAAIVMGGQS